MTGIPTHIISEQTAADPESYFFFHAQSPPELDVR
jgi:hypothetical protein